MDTRQSAGAPAESKTPEAEQAAPDSAQAAVANDGAQTAAALAQAPVKVSVKLSGAAKVGKKIAARPSVKASGVKVNLAYTWYVSGKKVATGKTYVVKAKDLKKTVKVVAKASWAQTGAYSAGSKTAKSSGSKAAKQKAVVKAKVRILGKAKAGNTLKAKATVKKTKGLKVRSAYVWYVGGKKVKVGKTLKVKNAYIGKKIKVAYKASWKPHKLYKQGVKQVKSAAKKASHNRSLAAIAKTARNATGIPYVWGGSSRKGADCSGLVKYVYGQHGVSLPGTDSGIRAKGKPISASKAKPGDVIYWPGHVAIYAGNGKMIEAQLPGTKSTVAPIRGGGTFLRIV